MQAHEEDFGPLHEDHQHEEIIKSLNSKIKKMKKRFIAGILIFCLVLLFVCVYEIHVRKDGGVTQVFSCTWDTEGESDDVWYKECGINDGNVINKTSGYATIQELGDYALNFWADAHISDNVEITVFLYKKPHGNGNETTLALVSKADCASACSFYFNVIETLSKGDKIYIGTKMKKWGVTGSMTRFKSRGFNGYRLR